MIIYDGGESNIIMSEKLIMMLDAWFCANEHRGKGNCFHSFSLYESLYLYESLSL